MSMKRYFIIVVIILGTSFNFLHSQSINSGQLSGFSGTINPITTAVPFLMISPDSKQGAMGDVERRLTQI